MGFFWDGVSPFFKSDSLFVDLPFNHNMMQLKLSNLGNHYKLLMLGFIDTFAGPEDVYGWALNNGY